MKRNHLKLESYNQYKVRISNPLVNKMGNY